MNSRLIITCGDPNGIGPEIILKIFSNTNLFSKYHLKVIGPSRIFKFYSQLLMLKNLPEEALINLRGFENFKPSPGRISKSAGRISGDAIRAGTFLTQEKNFSALVTMPISKEAINAGGYSYPGHTEMLSYLTKSKNTLMLMCAGKLRIAAMTTHLRLKDVPKTLSKKYIIEKTSALKKILNKNFKISKPKIAILALNPHAGDGGVTGTEEIEIMIPAIKYLKKKGLNINGPFPADGFFAHNSWNKFHAVLAVYHDQAMIPFKILSGNKGVNFTGGLKIIRTSPSHGTAFDAAGKGIADITSAVEAIELAAKLSEKRT